MRPWVLWQTIIFDLKALRAVPHRALSAFMRMLDCDSCSIHLYMYWINVNLRSLVWRYSHADVSTLWYVVAPGCKVLSVRDAYVCVAIYGKCLSVRDAYMDAIINTTTATTITFAVITTNTIISITNIYTSWNTPLRSGLVSRSLVAGPCLNVWAILQRRGHRFRHICV